MRVKITKKTGWCKGFFKTNGTKITEQKFSKSPHNTGGDLALTEVAKDYINIEHDGRRQAARLHFIQFQRLAVGVPEKNKPFTC